MNGQNKAVATKTQAGAQDAPELNSTLCGHCNGEGECDCPKCAPSPDGEHRDDFDSGRQMECTCKICLGFGRLTSDGKPLVDEEERDIF